MWQGINNITGFKGNKPATVNIVASLPDEPNTFYARFEADNTAHTERAPAAAAEVSPLSLSVADVTRSFKWVNIRKAVGPDGIPGRAQSMRFPTSRGFYRHFQSVHLSVCGSLMLQKTCVLSPLLYSLYTHDCTATHSSNVIVKFADDTMGICLITDNDETAYREEVNTLTKWCQENHLSLNIDKIKELVVDYRRQSRAHTPITIDKTPVERVNSFKFLGVHITEDLTWSAHTDAVLKKAHQRLFLLRRLRKFGMSSRILRSFYTCTVESILTGCITAWFGNSTAGNRRALQRVVRTARHIVGGELPSLQDIYTRR